MRRKNSRAIRSVRPLAATSTFTLTSHIPVTNAIGVDANRNITASFSADVNTATVLSNTFAAHTAYGGLLTGTLSVSGDTITLDPHRAFFAGERVQVSANSAISSTTGDALAPSQWGFTAGPVTARCVVGFTDIDAGLIDVAGSSVAWGDYDNDGDLDILLTGENSISNPHVTKLYRNDNGSFTDSSAGLTGVDAGSVAWGDYDNDGDLDILLSGRESGSSNVTKVYRNDNGSFVDIAAGLPGVYLSSVAWGDYDNDGDLDILLTGTSSSTPRVAQIYRNDNGAFVDSGTADDALTGVNNGSVAWGDYDNDGDLDILLTGSPSSGRLAKLYRNDEGSFVDSGTADDALTPVNQSSVAWGDYDNDGDLDILLTGSPSNGGNPITRLYRNDNGSFVDSGTADDALAGLQQGSASWGDYDNDGDLDILLVGKENSGRSATVYRNENGVFAESGTADDALTGAYLSSAVWGDYDGDGDLDILLTGSGNSAKVSEVYRNDDCPDVAVSKAVTPSVLAPGEAITYTLAFSSTGEGIATNVVLSDSLSVSVTVTGVTSSTFGSGVVITQTSGAPDFAWTISDLAADAGGIITLTGTVSDSTSLLSTTLTNTATISASNDGIQSNNSSSAALDVVGVTVAVSPASVAEDAADVLSYLFTRSGSTANPLTVNFSVAGDAAFGSDYAATGADSFDGANGSVTIPVASTSASVTVDPTSDSLDENDETVDLTVVSGRGYGAGTPVAAFGTINDDDASPTVTLSLDSTSIAENGGSAIVTGTLSALSGLPVTVTLGFGGTATVTDDYTRSDTQIVIGAGGTSGSITVDAVQDTLDENDETVIIDISGVTNGTESGSQQQTITINDDDPLPTVTLSVDNATIGENGDIATFTATLNTASGLPVSITLGFSGTASTTADYTQSGAQIVIPAGSISGSVTVTAVQDTLDENDETVIVEISSVENGTESGSQQQSTAITDDDSPPTVTLSLSDAAISENGGAATFSAHLSTASSFPVTVTLDFSGTATLTDDYTRSGTQIVIPAGGTSGSVSVTAVPDILDETDETVIAAISGVVNGTESGSQQQTLAINDAAAPHVSLSLDNPTIVENGGAATLTVTLNTTSTFTLTVTLGFGGTATSGNDYTRSATQIVIPAGSTTGSVTVTAVQDALDENDETVIVDIASVTNGRESGTQQQSITITDDDPPPTVTLSVDNGTIAESGGVAIFDANLSAVSGLPVTVTLGISGTAGETDDYTLSDTQIVVPAGNASAGITVSAVQDTTDENDETVVVDITGVTNGTESGSQQRTTTITDDDEPPSVTLSVDNAAIGEAAGVTTFTASLSAASSFAVTVALGFTGTATFTDDYTRSATQIVIPAGSTAGSVTVTAVQDGLDENDETVIVDITGVTNGTESGSQQRTTTITDDDDPPSVTLSVDTTVIAESAGVAIFTASLSAVSGLPVTVDLGFGGTAILTDDYTRSGAQIVIPAGSTAGNITVTAVQDSLDESDETVIVDITGVTNGTESGSQQQTVTISDDDDPPTVTLSIDNAAIAEAGGAGTFTANLSADSGLPVTIYLSFSGTARLTDDYTRSGVQIVIPAGSTTGSLTVTAVQDTLDENDETVIVDITGVTNGTESGSQQQTTTITDDDDPPAVTLSVDDAVISEAAGVAIFTASLSAISGLPVTVDLGFGGTATLIDDYTRSGARIVIPAGSTSGSVTVTAVQDTLDEDSETVIVGFTALVNGRELIGQQSTITISDDDDPPSVTLSVDNTAIAEADGEATFTASLSVVSGLPVTVDLGFGGTATLTDDYTRAGEQIVIPAGSISGNITITAVQDSLDETSETVLVGFSNLVNGIESSAQHQTVTITDDDEPPTVTLGVESGTIYETEGTATIVATLSDLSGLPVTVNLGFGGTATLTDDYTRSGTQILIAPGSASGSVTVTGVQDSLDEGDETVIVDITAVTNGTESGTQQQSVTITDANDPPTVSLTADNTDIAEDGGTAIVTTTLSAVSTLPVTVNLGFGGTATLTDDYTFSGTQILIAPGSTSGSVTVTAVQDVLDEKDETVIVTISDVTHGTEDGNQFQTITIADDDDPVTAKHCEIGFREINTNIVGVARGSVAWGDYDNDGDLDILLTGDAGSVDEADVYRNDGDGLFTDIGAGLIPVQESSVAWGDYDNDGDLDILLIGGAWVTVGSTSTLELISKLYRNDGNDTFTDINANLTGVRRSSGAMGDYDNDGDLDILITGWDDNSGRVAKIYRNDGNDTFTDIGADLTAVDKSSVAWGDYDNDGDLDILLSGTASYDLNIQVTKIYRNDGNDRFRDSGASLTDIGGGDVAWGDYDNDGDLDILLSGYRSVYGTPVSRVYRNNGDAGFANIGAGLTSVGQSRVSWGDYDTDGDLDILLTGREGGVGGDPRSFLAQIYRNDGDHTFTDINAGLTGVDFGTAAWGDYDNDGSLDILLTGDNSANSSKIYRNSGCADVQILKSLTPTSVEPGDAITYTLSFGNLGPNMALDVEISDSLPVSLTITDVAISTVGSDVTVQQTGEAPNFAWAVSDLAAGDGGTITLVGRIKKSGALFGTDITNSATVSLGNENAETNNSDSVSTSITSDYFRLTERVPGAQETSAAMNTDISASFDAELDIGSATNTSFAAHSAYGGLLNGTLTVSGNTLSLNPERALFAGERVQISATPGIRDSEGRPLYITQWGFNAGSVSERCVAGFVEQTGTGFDLTGVRNGSVAWADYDNDGDLDILLSGRDAGFDPTTELYRNDGDDGFVSISTALPGLVDSSVAWGDYDNDGDLDILMTGNAHRTSLQGTTTRLYRNDGAGTDTEWQFELASLFEQRIRNGSVAWGDYNNDGDLDILLTGRNHIGNRSYPVTRLYGNDGGALSDINAGLTDVWTSGVAWGDYDNDGDLDILLAGEDSNDAPITRIYRNDGISFEEYSAGLTDVKSSSVAWGDYDNDGDLDILLAGQDSNGDYVTKVYGNDGVGNFSDIAANLTGVSSANVAWGDYDNDGDLDILLAGLTSDGNGLTRIYRNDNGVFNEFNAGLTGVRSGSVAWGDYDNDGDLDILLTGRDSTGSPVTKLYRNDDCAPELQVIKTASVASPDEGGTVTYTVVLSNTGNATATDVHVSDSMTGTLSTGLTLAAGEQMTFTYGLAVDDGPATLVNTATVTSAEDLTGVSSAVTVTWQNVAPALADLVATSTDEGGSTSLSGRIIEPASSDALTLTVDWGDGANESFGYAAGTGQFTETHTYADDQLRARVAAGQFTLGVTVQDDDGGSSSESVQVTVANLPPSADAGGPYTVTQGSSVQLSGSGADVAGDPLSFDWDLDGNGSFETTGQNPTFDTAAVPAPSVQTVTLRVSDDDGGSSTDTATVTVTVPDADGVEESVEESVPNPDGNGTGDGNGDGIPDKEQGDVSSLPNAVDGNYVTLVSESGAALEAVAAFTPPVAVPAEVALPQGLLTFRVSGLTPGNTHSITLILHAGALPTEYWKFGPTPANPTAHWYDFNYNGTTGAIFNGNRITLHFVDGLRGDSDLNANGIITDPGGPALRANHYRWLPSVANRLPQPSAADLTVERLLAAANDVQVVIKNVGKRASVEHFWVDVYIDPATPPTGVNQIWTALSLQGAVWGVTQSLAPGESLTLSLNDPFYATALSSLGPVLTAGQPVYAQVDSWNPATDYGAVREEHEIRGQPYNNIAHTTVRAGVRMQESESSPYPADTPRLPDRAIQTERLWLPALTR